MNAPSFLIIVISFAVLMYWYLVNLKEGKNGGMGIFAMKSDYRVMVPGTSKQIEEIDKDPLADRPYAAKLRARVAKKGIKPDTVLDDTAENEPRGVLAQAKMISAKKAEQQEALDPELTYLEAEQQVETAQRENDKAYRVSKRAAASQEPKVKKTTNENRTRRQLAGKAYRTRQKREDNAAIEPGVDQDFFGDTT